MIQCMRGSLFEEAGVGANALSSVMARHGARLPRACLVFPRTPPS